MRAPLPLIAAVLCALLAAVPAMAGDDPEVTEADIRRSREALASRYIPHEVLHHGPLVERIAPGPAPLGHSGESVLARMLELRLRALAGPRPADPRRYIQTGDLVLRVPLGESLDVRPGMRIEYERHPVDDLWVGDPMPMLSVSVRF